MGLGNLELDDGRVEVIFGSTGAIRLARSVFNWYPHGAMGESRVPTFCSKRNLLRGTVVLLVATWGTSACRRDDGNDYGLGPDQDGDGWPFELDCDDHDDGVFPAADDIPGDGIDQDCSGADGKEFGLGGAGGEGPSGAGGSGPNGGNSGGLSETGGAPVALNDRDGDGFEASPDGDDCDDLRLEVHPGAVEIVLNGIDENCDGSDLVGLGEATVFSGMDAVLGEAPDLTVVEHDGEPHLLVVWADSRVAPRQDVYGQLLTLEGEAVGEELEVDTEDNNAKAGVRLATKGDGALAVWATADGVFAQQLETDGSLRGILFGLGEAGAQRPVPAYGGEETKDGGAWAVAWLRPGEEPGNQAQLRAMSTDVEAVRATTTDLGGPSDAISAVTLTGTKEGFLAVWEGPIGEERGLVGQSTSRVGQVQGDSTTLFEGDASSPAVAFDGAEFFIGFRTGGAFGYAAGRSFESLAEPGDVTKSFRLSSESLAQEDFRAVFTNDGFFTAWNDGRHWTHSPAIDSIYGNVWNAEAGAQWSQSRAFFAADNVELGGVAVVDDFVYFAVKVDSVGYLLREPIE